MTLVKEHEGDYAEIVEFLEEKLASYFTVAEPEADPIPEGAVVEATQHFPYVFGAGFPVGGVSELTHEGETGQGWGPDNIPAPEFIDVGVRIYHPSLTLATDSLLYEDGRHVARRVTRKVYAAWREKFYADYDLRGLVRHLTLGRVEAGDHDRLGNPFTQGDTEETILWVHAAVARFYL